MLDFKQNVKVRDLLHLPSRICSPATLIWKTESKETSNVQKLGLNELLAADN